MDYAQFTEPSVLKEFGRDLLKMWTIHPFDAELAESGLPVPSVTLADEEYFPALSRLFRSLDERPQGLRQAICAVLRAGVQLAAESAEEFAKLWFFLRLKRQDTGRSLLKSIQGRDAMQHEYPEALTPEQTQEVGYLLDFLRDAADMMGDVEPSHLLEWEQSITQSLAKLKALGLSVFTGHYRAKQVLEDGNVFRMAVAFVLLAANDDPRITLNLDGTAFLTVSIARGSRGHEAGESDSAEAAGKAVKEAEGKAGSEQAPPKAMEPVVPLEINDAILWHFLQKILDELDGRYKSAPMASQVFVAYCRDGLTLKKMEKRFGWKYRTIKSRKAELEFLLRKSGYTLDRFIVDRSLFRAAERQLEDYRAKRISRRRAGECEGDDLETDSVV